MRTVITMLPPRLRSEVLAHGTGGLAEIHLRRDRRASLTYYRKIGCYTVALPLVLSGEELQACLTALCGGSVYAHTESLCEGFLTLEGGVRVGVAGRAVIKEGRITAVAEVSSLVLRLPHRAEGAADMLVEHVRRTRRGLLLYGPPGVGKTTLLRELTRELARGAHPWRCAVIDARGELGSFDEECLVDVLSGYPKSKGLEIAVRTLAPEAVVLDEIGREEAEGLLCVCGMGVVTLASAHGGSVEELLSRPPMARLLESGSFGYTYCVGDDAPSPLL